MERLWLEDPHGDPEEGPSSRSKQRPAATPGQHGGPATWGVGLGRGRRRQEGPQGDVWAEDRGQFLPHPDPVSPRECSQDLMKEVGQQLPR